MHSNSARATRLTSAFGRRTSNRFASRRRRTANGWRTRSISSATSSVCSTRRTATPCCWCSRPWTPRVANVVGHLSNGVSEPVLQRAFEYWRNIDKNIGKRIAEAVIGA
ncbi:catalase-related domain-containing protein [Rhodoferax sp.]|uniref:catalase-related domain-containing protein n=1 Tax=Rhodoferax sp. TaxID=50421 RepID=UPI00343A0479